MSGSEVFPYISALLDSDLRHSHSTDIIYLSRPLGKRTGGTVQNSKNKRQINTPEKLLIPVIKLASFFYKAHAALMIFKEFELDDKGGQTVK